MAKVNLKLASILAFICSICFTIVLSYPEQGKWDYSISNAASVYQTIVVTKSISAGGKFVIKISCNSLPGKEEVDLDVTWYIRKLNCWKEYYIKEMVNDNPEDWFKRLEEYGVHLSNQSSEYVSTEQHRAACNSHGFYLVSRDNKMHLKDDSDDTEVKTPPDSTSNNDETTDPPIASKKTREVKETDKNALSTSGTSEPASFFDIDHDGIYQLILGTNAIPGMFLNTQNQTYTAHIHIDITGPHGYLSAADYPLLIFYSIMCVVYVLYGIAWLIVCFMRWRELLRVQYWIGAVIFLGMLEKAFFTAEYESVNENGRSYPGLIVTAELVSCAKRTLARLLVIIVSFGFGIVKPRLGVVLNRVVGVGLVYFVVASIEGCLRALSPNFPNGKDYRTQYFSTVPLALLEFAICWWVFSALVTTTRTLRLRRNITKLNLYRHFTNTLAFAVLVSVVFMLWSIKYFNLDLCVSDWKQMWVNDAFWHVLFALLLLVIMFLWRPTNNNQRFAYSALLDGLEEDEEAEEKLMADVSDTMKLRGGSRNSNSSSPRESRSVEEDLKWLEENIPSTLADAASLPGMNSEDEIMNTKFEISKMQ